MNLRIAVPLLGLVLLAWPLVYFHGLGPLLAGLQTQQATVCPPANDTVLVASSGVASLASAESLGVQVTSVNGTLAPDAAPSRLEDDFSQCPVPLGNLTVLSAARRNPRPAKPELCVAFLTMRRYDLLDRTMESIVSHLETTNITYELVLWENWRHPNCSSYAQRMVVEKYQVNKWGASFNNLGISFGLETLFAGYCRAPYILSLEDDWIYKYWRVPYGVRLPLLELSMQVIAHDPQVIGVYLGDIAPAGQSPNDTFRTTPQGRLYRMFTPAKKGAGWCRYSNGGVVLGRDKLLRVGHQDESGHGDHESVFRNKVFFANMTMAWLTENTKLSKKEAHYCLKHIGGGDRHVDRKAGRVR